MVSVISDTTAVDDIPEVKELKAKLDDAKAELQAAEAELDHLHKILNPLPSSSEPAPTVSERDVILARQQIQFVRDRYLLAQAELLDRKQSYERVHSEATQQVNRIRSRARLPLLRRFATTLEEARAVGDELLAFDLETIKLGGSNPGHPFGDLSDSLPYRQGVASRVRQLVNELERHS